MQQSNIKKWNLWQKVLGVVAGIAAGFLLFKFALPWVMPFIFALILARIIEPLIRYIVKKTGIKRSIVVAAVILLTFVILITAIYLIVSFSVGEIFDFIRSLPDYIGGFSEIIDVIRQKIIDITKYLPPEIASALLESLDSIVGSIELTQEGARTLLQRLGSFAISLPNAFIFIITLVVATFLIASDYEGVTQFLVLQIPDKWLKTFYRTKKHLINTVWKWLKAISILLIITFIELCVGLTLLEIKHTVFVAAIIALVDMLPILGVGTVLFPWALYEFLIGNVSRAVTIIILYAVINLVRNLIEPKIVGEQIGLPPIVMLLSVYIGLKTLGIAGVFLIPIVVIMLLKFQEWGYIRLFKLPPKGKNS